MNVLIFIYLLIIGPKLLFDWVVKGKKHPGLLQRFGFCLPNPDRPVIWIHAVSVGEVKAAQPLFQQLRQIHKDAFFLITTTSATGQEEAKRSLSQADAFSFLPIDLSWVVRKWVKKLKPIHFILVESDFWPQLLSALKSQGTTISLVSGKMSARSAHRLQKIPFFAKKLFAHFDHLCVQNEEHRDRFLPFFPHPDRLHITGNLKLDIEPQPVSQILDLPQSVITISCTHANEEEQLLDVLKGGEWFTILAPRHPERFEEVASLLTRKNIPFCRWSQKEIFGKVLLLDAMGKLPICYSQSRLAILGGSFVTHVGGHNVLEPCLYGAPVLFGPYMHGQLELAQKVLKGRAGFQVSLPEVRKTVLQFFENLEQQKTMKEATFQLVQENRGATLRTLHILNTLNEIRHLC